MRASRTLASVSRPASASDDDGLAGADDVTGVLREAAVEADVDRPGQMARRERLRRAGVEDDGAVSHDSARGPRVQGDRRLLVVEQVTISAVGVGREGEVERRHRLALGHGLDEVFLGHGLQGVVGGPLLPDGRADRVGHRLAARRPGAMGRVHEGGIGKREELIVHRAVEAPGEVVGRPADRSQQVGATDVTDEQGVAGEHRPRFGVGLLADHDRDRLGGVAGRVADLEVDLAEREVLAVGQGVDLELGLALVTEETTAPVASASSRWPERKSAWKWVSITRLDRQAVGLGVLEVPGDVTLGVDHDGTTGGLVPDQVAEQRQAGSWYWRKNTGSPRFSPVPPGNNVPYFPTAPLATLPALSAGAGRSGCPAIAGGCGARRPGSGR